MLNWISLRSLLTIASINSFTSISIYFVLAFPQSDLDVDVFMYLTLGMGVDGNILEWVLKLNKLLYGLKQASANLFGLLKNSLESRVFHQYQVGIFVFDRKDSFILTCVDVLIIVSHTKNNHIIN